MRNITSFLALLVVTGCTVPAGEGADLEPHEQPSGEHVAHSEEAMSKEVRQTLCDNQCLMDEVRCEGGCTSSPATLCVSGCQIMSEGCTSGCSISAGIP
jgi:hypothetical protein